MYSDRQSDPFQATKIQKPEPNVWWKIKMKRKDKKNIFLCIIVMLPLF